MATAQVFIGTVFEDGGAAIMGRVQIHDGSNAQQADITSITYSVFDVTGKTPDTAISGHSGASLTVADVIFDALQTDSRWTKDTTGYNFRQNIAATAFPTGNHVYEVEYKFTPATGEVFWVKYSLPAVNIRTS